MWGTRLGNLGPNGHLSSPRLRGVGLEGVSLTLSRVEQN